MLIDLYFCGIRSTCLYYIYRQYLARVPHAYRLVFCGIRSTCLYYIYRQYLARVPHAYRDIVMFSRIYKIPSYLIQGGSIKNRSEPFGL